MAEEVFFNWRKKERELLNHLQVIVINIVLSTCASIMTYIQYWHVNPLYKGVLSIIIILFSASIAVFRRKFARLWIFVLLIWISYLIALNTFFELFFALVIILLLLLLYLIKKTNFFKI